MLFIGMLSCLVFLSICILYVAKFYFEMSKECVGDSRNDCF